MAKKLIFQGNKNTDFGVNNQLIFAKNVSKKADER